MTALKSTSALKATGIEARCAATGMRMTEQRRVIARVLAESGRSSRRRGTVSPLRRGRRQDLDLDGVSHRQAVRGRRHHRAARFPRGPRALRADARQPSRSPDQPARRQGDRIHRPRKSRSCRPKSPASSATSWSITGWSCIACRSTTTNPDRSVFKRSAGSREEYASGQGSTFDLVIFDCDGVLVDSEVISCRAHAEMLTRHGYPITPDQVLERFLGRSIAQATLEVETETRPQLCPSDFEIQVIRRRCGCLRRSLRAIPHIGEALAAIGTARLRRIERARRKKIAHSLTCAGLYDRFAPTSFPPRRSSAASRRRTCFCSPPADAGAVAAW